MADLKIIILLILKKVYYLSFKSLSTTSVVKGSKVLFSLSVPLTVSQCVVCCNAAVEAG